MTTDGAAPGASVILVSPQATLDRKLTGWDDRFPSARRIDFSERYAYAPDLLEAAERAVLLFDPDETEDAVHASLFRSDNVTHFPYRRGGAGAIESDLRNLALIPKLAEAAAAGTLNPSLVARLMRARRTHAPYLRALLSRVLAEDRPELTVQLCRAVLRREPSPRFRHHLERAEIQLGIRPAPPPGSAVEDDDQES